MPVARRLCLLTVLLLAAAYPAAAHAAGLAATKRVLKTEMAPRARRRRVRDRPRHGPPAVRPPPGRAADAGLGEQALHDLDRAAALRADARG